MHKEKNHRTLSSRVLGKKNKGIKLLVIISFVLLIADLVSTIYKWELVEYLEANPLFPYGGLPLIILVNLIFYFGLYFIYYRTKKVDARFYITLAFVIVGVLRIVAIVNNIDINSSDITLEDVKAIDPEDLQKAKEAITWKMIINGIVPYLIMAVTWMFFKRDHQIKIIN